ncbi:hypothetical protein C1H46_045829 [Malus baccata]|uniref:Uncharacterized protein n=1 Tax=Malus baccata TaxID=106549 RepID=A0A540K2Z8_MALBA|nr:hypothetical protein C1H46_045829 [Malus baccata]
MPDAQVTKCDLIMQLECFGPEEKHRKLEHLKKTWFPTSIPCKVFFCFHMAVQSVQGLRWLLVSIRL